MTQLAANADNLRIGLMGVGGVCAAVHYPGLSRIPGVTIQAICDPNAELVSSRAAEWGVSSSFTNVGDLLAEGLDAVVIATPNDQHRPLIEAALDAGCHVLCEKPLGMSLSETIAIYEKAEASGLRHMTAFTYRFVPAMNYLRHLVHTGVLGEIRHARVQRLQDWGEDAIGWRQYRQQAGLGELGDMGIHRIDYAEDLLGKTLSVCARMKQLVPRDQTADGQPCPPQDVEDWVAWLAEYESGATCVFEMGKLSKGRGPGGDHDLCEINGTVSSAIYHLHEPHQLLLGGRQQPYRVVPVPSEFLTREGSPRDPHAGDPVRTFRYDQAWEFVSAIRESRPCLPSFWHGMRAQAVAEAVVLADRDRRWVDIPQIPDPPTG
ncbi:MAG: Gfo/Idh/MocA family oxidoreductase [Gemmatimonadetes bacterium]|jgi:predicted dehydrogenase|nr:Gfo/Idh/MocA family oxidoreductase [Gemmatimonadota bacterium]MBT4610749.1 Gfo/Idh/MocA family oxidoreductase [Gemmatimonadota bacterium]MBT5058108.1 Gfo/Idh/MocA family oxidoreductase [Gemmatimonadota bacterium]MBT5142444.1 Gfo/Idh/MocA family oxidoreductase [Gemmatimonadota bacterium]MBT5586374.1 Gfo/Idh/MocA family oxidoreductase [Gemmatimonadota bacterium]